MTNRFFQSIEEANAFLVGGQILDKGFNMDAAVINVGCIKYYSHIARPSRDDRQVVPYRFSYKTGIVKAFMEALLEHNGWPLRRGMDDENYVCAVI